MSNVKKSFVFFGNERLATGVTTTTPILNGLIDSGYIPQLIVVSNTTSKSRKNRELEILHVAKAHAIPVLNTNNTDELLEHINNTGATFAVLAAYGRMVPQKILDVFPDGIINIHPSLLPKHRGPTPIESVLLAGERNTGVSIMKLVKAMDAGPVYLQKEIEVLPNESKQELCDRLSHIGATLLTENLDKILKGEIVAKEQNDSDATYDSLIKKEDGIIKWDKPADVLIREIRAYKGWPSSKTTLGSVDVIITKASAIETNNPSLKPGTFEFLANQLCVQTQDGQLCIERLKPAGKQEMACSAFLAGYRNRLS